MSGDLESLYPFLFGPPDADLVGLRVEAATSTRDKLSEIADLRVRVLTASAAALQACATALVARFAAGGRLLVFGNGGSATDAGAICELFSRPPWGTALPALSLASDTAVITALANDVGFEVVFARQVASVGRPADVAWAVSTSGGSANVLRALAEAGRMGMTTVGLAGYDGGPMAEPGLVDHLFVVPSASVHRIQEAQTTLYHRLWALTQQALT